MYCMARYSTFIIFCETLHCLIFLSFDDHEKEGTMFCKEKLIQKLQICFVFYQ